ncbi:lipopolysaccharide biosynthesis protein [Kingella potus]|uniref:lipopolysaccharide biosynthesis protein n=1 Tax=Kingella potus TaxID=265175 RepID=UPI001FD5B264|nr:oligosaccharide flippase family protein [Kingella potus]UOP00407.1 oligosaccharide flippase family protein [Kingella potus]
MLLLQAAASLALITFGLGLDQFYIREFHQSGNRAALFKTAALPPLALAAAACAALYAFAPQWPSEKILSLADSRLGGLCLLFAAALMLSRYLSLVLRMNDRALAFSFAQLLPKLLLLAAAAAWVLLRLPAGTFALVSVYAFAQLAAALLLLWQTRHEWPAAARSRIRLPELSAALAYGLPLAAGGLAYWAFSSADRWLLRTLAGAEELGVYALAVNFGAAASVLQSVFATVWSPLVFRRLAEGKTADVGGIARRMAFVLAAAVCLCALLSPAAAWVLPPQYAAVPFILPAVMLVPLLYTLAEATGIGIHVRRKSSLIPLVSLAALACAAALLYLLVPHYGARGAAAASAAAFWLFFLLKSEASARLWQPLPRGAVYGTTAACLALCCAFALCGSTANFPAFAALWAAALAAAAWGGREDLGRLKTRLLRR